MTQTTMDNAARAGAKEQLAANLRRVIADAEDLLAATAQTDADGSISELRRRIQGSISAATDAVMDSISSARERMADADAVVRERARYAASVSDDYVHDHPWSTIGAAAAVGFILGLLLSRR